MTPSEKETPKDQEALNENAKSSIYSETALQNNDDSVSYVGALGLPETEMNFVL